VNGHLVLAHSSWPPVDAWIYRSYLTESSSSKYAGQSGNIIWLSAQGSVTHSCGWPVTARPPGLALQLLRPDDVGISGVQAEQRLHLLALACAGGPALPGDLYL
jgi:hypothetical protein